MRKVWPALALFFVAPLVSEFLLGDLPITMLGSLVILAPVYGGGAVLIRETVRRRGGGWTNILVLALGYAILEEAFLTQTLFNPDYLGLNMHLLQPGYVPALGIGAWWTVYVLTLHTVWSISVSIGLVEALVPERADVPWLGKIGLGVIGLLFALAAGAMASYSVKQDSHHFVATTRQFVASGVILLAVVFAGLSTRRHAAADLAGNAPSPWLAGAVAFGASSIFMIVPNRLGWWAVAIYLLLDLAVIGMVWRWSHQQNWDGRHRLALAGGAAMTYAWHGFVQKHVVGSASPMVHWVGSTTFTLALIVVLSIAARRNRQAVTI